MRHSNMGCATSEKGQKWTSDAASTDFRFTPESRHPLRKSPKIKTETSPEVFLFEQRPDNQIVPSATRQ